MRMIISKTCFQMPSASLQTILCSLSQVVANLPCPAQLEHPWACSLRRFSKEGSACPPTPPPDLLWLGNLGNLGEEKAHHKQVQEFRFQTYHLQVLLFPSSKSGFTQFPIHPSPPSQLGNTNPEEPSQSVLEAWPGSFWVSVVS